MQTLLLLPLALVLGCSTKDKDRDLAAPSEVKGGCMYEGSIVSDGLKYKGSKPAPESSGEQCRTNVAQKDCLDPKLFDSSSWSDMGCPDTYVAKCPLGKTDWFLYVGPTTHVVAGGTDAQRLAFSESCRTEGKIPELK